MSVTVEHIRERPVSGLGLVLRGHETVRGAAGAAALDAEPSLAREGLAPARG